MTKLIALAALLFAFSATAEDLRLKPTEHYDRRAWTTFDTVMQGAVVASLVADWNQTLRIGAECREINPILGQCPTHRSVNVYFASTIVVHTIAAVALPKPWRTVFQGATIGFEAATVRRNIRLGWSIRF